MLRAAAASQRLPLIATTMRALALALLMILCGATAAQAQLTLCNRTDAVILSAQAVENDDGELQVAGWTRIAPGACVEVADNLIYPYAYYAHQPGADWVWEGEEDAVDLCVFENRDFKIDYGDIDVDLQDSARFSCPSGAVKVSFTLLENDDVEAHTVDLE